MLFEAIYHSTDSEYSHALDENTVVLRLRTKKDDIKKCVVCYGDRACYREPIPVDSLEMHVVASDRLFDYFEVEFHTEFNRICYYFILFDGSTSVYYYGNDFHDNVNCGRNQFFQFPCVRKEDIADVPDWAKKAVIYQIFPDSFASSKNEISCVSAGVNNGGGDTHSLSRLGGNLKGIIENIPYLEELGINCIYLNPIFTARSYHKYDTIDYFSVDPCFGDNRTLKDLVARCHASGIKVLLDGVFNHSGTGFFAFRDVMEKGEQSKYKDWFFIEDYPVRFEDNPNYMCFAYTKHMPKLNTGNPEVVEHFKNVGVYWIKEADIDGWRLDVANEVDHGFWREFRKAVKAVKPDAFLLAEIWHDSREWLMGDQFDSSMNYNFMYACNDFFATRIINAQQFSQRIDYLRMRYKKNVQYVQMNLLDSHDVPRFLSMAGGDVRRQKVAVLFMMTHIGAPNIYYGDEKGFDGMTEQEYRKSMQWQDTEYSKEMFQYYKKLIAIRKDYLDCMLGDYVTLDADIAGNVYAYSREGKGKRLIVVINNSEHPLNYELNVGANAGSATDLLFGRRYSVDNSRVTLELEAISGAILEM